MKAWLTRLGMSLIVTLGCATAKMPAQAPLVPSSQEIDPTPSTPLALLLARPEAPVPSGHPHLNARGYCCDARADWFGCGNWKTQNDFVFGSCRTFFVEPCIPKPPSAHPRLHPIEQWNLKRQ